MEVKNDLSLCLSGWNKVYQEWGVETLFQNKQALKNAHARACSYIYISREDMKIRYKYGHIWAINDYNRVEIGCFSMEKGVFFEEFRTLFSKVNDI